MQHIPGIPPESGHDKSDVLSSVLLRANQNRDQGIYGFYCLGLASIGVFDTVYICDPIQENSRQLCSIESSSVATQWMAVSGKQKNRNNDVF